MAEDIKRSDLLLSLIKLEKDKGFVSLVDVIAAKKAYKEGKSYTNDDIIEALKEFDVHYTESEDGSDFDEEEPTEEELEGKVSLEDPLSLDDDEFDDFDDDEPTADDLNELEKDVDFNDDDEKKRRDDDDDEEDDDDDEELSPAVERIMTIAGVALAIIIVVIMLLLFSRMLGIGKGQDKDNEDGQQTEEMQDDTQDDNESGANTVVMPNLLGKTMTEAKTELADLGISITLKGSETSGEYAAGQIISQNIKDGERVEVGSSVEVITAGAGSGAASAATPTDTTTQTEETDKQVTVPPVTGQTEAAARSAIEAAGLKVGTVTEANSDTVPSGNVISQSLSANTSAEKNSTVNLVISKGPNKTKVTDVIGHEVNRATEELQAAGFVVGVKEVYSNEIKKDLVISSSPDRGTYAEPGSTVTITVSKGKEQVTIPSVSVGMTFEEAAERLEDAGFDGTIRESGESSESVGEGFVTRYDPSGTVDPEGTVTIYVSTGSAAQNEPTPPETTSGLPSD